MKKILVVISVMMILLVFTGCGKKNEKKLDLEKIEIEVNSMTIEKSGKTVKMFGSNKNASSELLKEKYDVDTSYFEEFLISMPTLVESASMYAIFLPVKGKESKAQEEIDKLFEKYEASWSLGYAPEEEKRIKERLEDKYGNYLIYIVSNDNTAVFQKIKTVK